ncbi:MAG: ABC transporter substrate-binding protein, partial [Candidatus Aureabacteria bacterium]|nr:ABC transporter substrate-binding protein [Candidatus Auribacterota bacterium]
MKNSAFYFLSIACALAIAGCSRESGDALRIGVIAEITGDMPAVGASCRNAAVLAVKEINDAGGLVLGGKTYRVELRVEDNAGKSEQSATAAQKLITENNVVAIVGPNASRYAIPAAEIAESSRTVLITPWSTSPKTTLDARTGAPKRYVFRSCFIDPFQGEVVASFAREKLGAKTAAVLYDIASEYNKGIAEIFAAAYEKRGGKVVAMETYTNPDRDYSAQLTKIKQAGPEVIFLPNYYSEVPLQIEQAHRLGIAASFLGSDSWGSSDLIKLGGAELEGCYFSTHYAADRASPVAGKFIAAYRAAYGVTPDDVAALT